jgi:pullulanase/glycogen debranching enzyme
MKAIIPTKSALQEIKEEYNRLLQEAVAKEHANAIDLCIVTRMAADVDSGLAESTVLKTTKRWKSYIDSVHSGNVTLQEIKDTLKEENGIIFDWMGD